MEVLEFAVGILVGIFLCSMIPKIPIGINELLRRRQKINKPKKNGNESSNQGANAVLENQ